MFECTITDMDSVKCVAMQGRIDALSSSDIQKVFDGLILAGERTILVDMTAVNYVSSAGLRTFITTQKVLKKAGGEIILIGMTEAVFQIFKISGLTTLFRTAAAGQEVLEFFRRDTGGQEMIAREVNGIALEYMEMGPAKGSVLIVGNQDKMVSSTYIEEDVVSVKPQDMRFGCGLAALGDSYGEYKHLFGETMVINNTFFFYPAVPHSSVDFLINAHKDPGAAYKFLHGFGFSGTYRYMLSFHGKDGPVELPALVQSFFAISSADALGVCILAESKGLWGMHLKRAPIMENKPADGQSILDNAIFSDWIDYPVEPSYADNVIAATGIAVRERRCLGSDKAFLIPEGNNFHIHGGIFDKTPLGNSVSDFDKELMRIFSEREVYKVEHILGRTRFSGGTAAIIELEV